jgi:hypothetical protein
MHNIVLQAIKFVMQKSTYIYIVKLWWKLVLSSYVCDWRMEKHSNSIQFTKGSLNGTIFNHLKFLIVLYQTLWGFKWNGCC